MQKYTNESLEKFLESSSTSDSDFIRKLNLFEKNISKLNNRSKFNIYLNLSNAWGLKRPENNKKIFVTALDYAKKAECYMKDLPDDLKRHLFFVKGHIFAKIGNTVESKESFIRQIYFNLKNSSLLKFNGSEKIVGRIIEFKGLPLYSFRPINKFSISDLIKDELTVADPALFNDPFDTPLFSYLAYRRNKIQKESGYDIKPLCDAYKHIKVRCFVMDVTTKKERPFQNQLMWSHYADSHKGICIRYKFDHNVNSGEGNLLEFSNWSDVDYIENIEIKGPQPLEIRSLLATKNKCWEYENEVRLIHFDPECHDNFKQISLKESESRIEAIFFGCRCSEEDKTTIRRLFNSQPNIEFFEFQNIPEGIWNDIYSLDAVDEKRLNKLNSESSYGIKL